MYAQVEKPKEHQSKAAASSVAQKKSNVKQGFGVVDNRPEAAVLMKNDILMKDSKAAQLAISKCKNDVVQRNLKVGFRTIQNANVINKDSTEEILGLLKVTPYGINSVEEAINSAHTFWIRGKQGEYTLEITEAVEEKSKVNEVPKAVSKISINKPQIDSVKFVKGDEIVAVDSTSGAHHLEISGLIGCVGIIVEKRSGNSIQAAATHLLDNHYKSGDSASIDESGYAVIDDLLASIGVSASTVGSDGVTMTLVVSGEVQLDKMRWLVSKYISDKGGYTENFGQFTSKVFYSVSPS